MQYSAFGGALKATDTKAEADTKNQTNMEVQQQTLYQSFPGLPICGHTFMFTK